MEKMEKQQSESVNLEKIDGRELHAQMVIGDKIAEGGLGNIYMAHVQVGNHNIPLIFKQYKASSVAQERSQCAFENYQVAKQAGLKVFTTFRLVKNQDSIRGIIMTDGTTEETMCLASNYDGPTTIEDHKMKKMDQIENSDELIDAVFDQAILANEKSIYLDPDCFFFLVKKGDFHVDFVIGDMDHVNQQTDQNKGGHSETIYSAYSALESFINHNTVNPSMYLPTLIQKFRNVMHLYQLPFIYKYPEDK